MSVNPSSPESRAFIKDRTSIADVLSIAPGLGWLIGVCTVISNTVKVVMDLGKAATTDTWKGDASLYQRRVENLSDTAQLKEIDAEILSLPGYRAKHHASFILIGLIRLTPVIGSLFSLAKCCGVITLGQTIECPRAKVPTEETIPSFKDEAPSVAG